MLDHIFENRNKKLVNLIKLGDCLGRSLRENIEIFKISDGTNHVSYITESDKIINGNYDFEDNITLSNIVVEDADLYRDEDRFEQHVHAKVSTFIKSLYEDKYAEAEINFTDVLDSWTDRVKVDRTKRILENKVAKFNKSTTIVETTQFLRFIEVAPQLLDFLKENKEEIITIPEIRNAVKLSNIVSKAFNLPRLNYETLVEETMYELRESKDNSIYEMICKQELIKKDLLESKKQFDDSWATHDAVRTLAGLVYEDDKTITENLASVIEEVPYFAFISKKQISSTITNALSLGENQVPLPEKDRQQFVAKIFEMKKPVKKELTSILSEKYGVNVQNLKETPSFKSLINTQVLIFEMLSRLSPKESIQKDILKDVAKMLKEKTGVQGIDVNDCLKILFEAAGYTELIDDDELLNQITFQDALQDVESDQELKDMMNIDEKEKDDKGAKSKTSKNDDEKKSSKKDDKDDEKKSSKKDDEDDLKETADKETAPISKEEYLDALADMENILSNMGSAESKEDIAELQEKRGDKKGDKGEGKHDDEKDYEHKGDRKGDESEDDDKKKDYDDDDDDDDDADDDEKNGGKHLEKAKTKTKKKDRTYRKKLLNRIQGKAAKEEKRRKGPKELGDSDDEV